MKLDTFFFGFLAIAFCKHMYIAMFTEIPVSHSGVNFINKIQEDENYNILAYEYLYNGGGVAVGDISNDGLPDCIFTGNITPNKLYLNKGDFKFEDITDKAGLEGTSKWKTGVVMADVNGDGLQNIYICHSGPGTDEARSNELYINNGLKNGVTAFTESAKQYELDAPGTYTTTLAFFDMDNDGELDLYLVSGGADYPYNSKNYQDRIFENDGHGNFTKLNNSIPAKTISGSCVRAADINKDGLPDLLIGGRFMSGFFPKAPESYILKNKSRPGHILFEKDAVQKDTVLAHPGMVTDAVWVDLNKDGWEDLVVAGQFMPVTIFENRHGYW